MIPIEIVSTAHALASVHAAKDAAKAFFEGHHSTALWEIVRDRVLNYDFWLLAFIPAVMLEHLAPAEEFAENRRTELWLDFWYPVFKAAFAMPFIVIFAEGLKAFYRAHIPFLDTGLLDGKPMWLQMLGAFLITDFMFYVGHFLRHKIRWFWYFHAIHHSQEVLNPMTTSRSHALEGVINVLIRFVPIAFVGGSPVSWSVFVVLNGFWGYFIHANVRTNLGPLRYVVVSPQFHRVHHSKLPEHWDKNYGERLIVWDWMFGTMHPDMECYPPTGVMSMERWAVETKPGMIGFVTTWFRHNAYPFVKIGKSVAAAVRAPGELATSLTRAVGATPDASVPLASVPLHVETADQAQQRAVG